jgi:hypothetical protein
MADGLVDPKHFQIKITILIPSSYIKSAGLRANSQSICTFLDSLKNWYLETDFLMTEAVLIP